jgi:hypothetical protein
LGERENCRLRQHVKILWKRILSSKDVAVINKIEVFDLIDDFLVFENESTNKIKVNLYGVYIPYKVIQWTWRDSDPR